MATTLHINTTNYNISSSVSYTQNNYTYSFKVYTLDKNHYYDNISNVIPNPLHNNIINYNYSSYKFATSDLNGEENTKYLKRSKTNISNILNDNFYIPSIGELGISMENVQVINDSIENLGDGYEKYKLDDNKIYVSSTLHSSQNIYNKEYQITNNLNNVWNFNTSNAKISYNLITNNYNLLSFYRFDTNILTELDLNNEDITLNSINKFVNYELTVNNIKYYCEYNNPIDVDYSSSYIKLEHAKKLEDYDLNYWKLNPFSAKYFYTIINPECKDIIKNNFYNYYNTFKDENTFVLKSGNSYLMNTSRIGYISNNGVNYIPDKKEGTIMAYMSTYTHLYYNLPIYDNNLVLIPTIGSGENNYNVKKYYSICEFYLVVPKLIDYLKINVEDCEITKRIFLELGSFNMYYIKLSFNAHYPNSNVIEFITRYNSVDYSRKYYFSIYGCNISSVLSSDNNLSTYIDINNYYVARHSYGWWFNQGDKNGLSINKINGKFCYSNPIQRGVNLYDYPELYKNFLIYNSDYFKCNYDLSYLVNNISKSLNIGYGTSNNRGLRVERIIDNDTILANQVSGSNMVFELRNNIYNASIPSNINSNGYLFPYNIQVNNHIIGNEEKEELKSFKFIDSDVNYPLLEKNWWLFKYSYYKSSKYELSYNYHLFNINSYNYYNNSLNKLKEYDVTETSIPQQAVYNENNIIFNNTSTYNNSLSYYLNYNDLLNYIPVLRLYRTKDQYGIHNDLIFAYLYNSFKIYNHPNYLNYIELANTNKSFNSPVERYCVKTKNPKNSSQLYVKYLNKFNLNIPIVGSKQSLCLNMNLETEPLKLFRDKSNHYYLYSDYIFIYNNTKEDIEILMDDESLSLIDNRKAVFKINSGELKVYYPNNFNYNATYKEYKNEIYNIRLYNKSSNNIKFNIINIGNLNLDIQECIDNNIYIEDLIGYKYICYLNYLYDTFKNREDKINESVLSSKYNIIISIYDNIIKAKTKYLSDLDGYGSKFTKQQWKYKPSEFFDDEMNINTTYSNTYIDYYTISNNTKTNNWYKLISNTSTNYMPILSEYIEDKRININVNTTYTHNLLNNTKYLGVDNVNTIIKHNLDHIINLQDSELYQIYENYVNLSIKDYSLNKAGYLIILKNS